MSDDNGAAEIPAKPSADELLLTETERTFLTEYIRTGNASQAGRVAGLNRPGTYGWRMLKSVEIQAALKRELANKQIDAEHVLAELSELCFCSLRDFMDEEGVIDPRKVRVNGHLVKRYKCVKVRRRGDGKDVVSVENIEIELHDRGAYLVHMANRFGVFKRDTGEETARILEALAEILKAKYPAEEVGQVFRQLSEALRN